MGNVFTSFFSGFGNVLGKLFGSPIDFLSGKSCNSVCGATWDLICYIENFCVANLLKFFMVLVLVYIVLLFFYLLHKTGICYCIGRTLCKILWACLASCCYACEYGCMFLCHNMKKLKRQRRNHRRKFDQENYLSDKEESTSYSHSRRSIELSRSQSHQSRQLRRIHLQKSLRPRSHRIRVDVTRNAVSANGRVDHYKHHSTVHNIKVAKTSKFAKKGGNVNNKVYQRPRR
ncbi:hypothetical protein IFM89_012320 [Coptis chinensis]|uniref:Uncharacterized protein n=1 Tax=Coptis chinensis TaxID=261450 RepID=A0A835M348_9MAGN|nr:hypothetical protein IFM89_012320 [Coptis chinensis]